MPKKIKGREYVRMKVRIRDNFTCRDCGAVRTPKEVHKHNKDISGLKGRKKLFDVHHINGLCGKKSIGYDSIKDLSGMITLCHRCHYNRPEHRCQSESFSKGVLPDSRLKEIRQMRAQRYTLREIGAKYEITAERVRQLLLKPSKHHHTT